MMSNNNKKKKNLCLLLSIVGIMFATVATTVDTTTATATTATATATTDPSRFVGEWKLKEIWDSENNDTPRNLWSDEGPFILRLESREHANDNDNEILGLNVKVANSIFSYMEFLDDNNNNNNNNIRVGSMMSTLMMPSPELYQLEIYLSNYLPQMTSMELGGRGESEKLLIMTTSASVTSDGNEDKDGATIDVAAGHHQAKIVWEAVIDSEA